MKSMKYRHIAAALLLLGCGTIQAEETTNAYQFLNITPSSHVYGLGGHNITIIDDDINLVEQNPALLGPEIDHQVGLNYMKYIGSTNFMGARYGQGLTEHSAIAVGLQYYGYGTFEANDINFNVTYTHDITDNLRGGITLKYLYSKYEEYTAGAITADLGVNYYNPDNELSLSLVLKNLGGQVKKFNDRTSDVPWDIQVGISKMLKSAPIRFSLTAYNLRYWHLPYYKIADKNNPNSEFVKEDKFGANLLRHLVFGIEVLPTDKIYIGLGYNHKVRTDMSTYQRNFLSGFSLGAGMRVKAFGFGVALAQPHTSATTFMVNLTTSIGELMH